MLCQSYYLLSWQWLHLNTKYTWFPNTGNRFEIPTKRRQKKFDIVFVIVKLKYMRSRSSRQQDPLWSSNVPQTASTSRKLFRQCLLRGVLVLLSSIDGKAGLLILEKLLICFLLALRALIKPIVALVPLRPEWMSLLCYSFPLALKWRCSHLKKNRRRVRRQPASRLHTPLVLILIKPKNIELPWDICYNPIYLNDINILFNNCFTNLLVLRLNYTFFKWTKTQRDITRLFSSSCQL